MRRSRVSVTITLLSLALLVLAFAGTNFLTAPIGFIFRNAAGLSTANMIAQLAGWLTTVCLFAAAAFIAIPAALEPAGWVRKSIKVLPIYLLGFTLAMLIANFIGLATLGTILSEPSPIRLSLAAAGLAVGAVLTTLAVVVAIARVNLDDRVLKAVTVIARIGVVPGLILSVAMLWGVSIVMTSQTGQPSAGAPAAPPAGGPGNFGGLSSLISQIEIGSALMGLFALIALLSVVLGVRLGRGPAAAVSAAPAQAVRVDYRREVMHALIASAAISAIAFVAIQLVPVSHTNPPVGAAVQWDSAQTKDLVTRTCMNCHSNETEWPWYANFAPGSWLTIVHVTSARSQFNLSELNKMPSNRKTRLARDMAEAIRNGNMPPIDFLFMHPEAQLTAAEKDQLILGLQNSLK
jgi:hypothetical protein